MAAIRFMALFLCIISIAISTRSAQADVLGWVYLGNIDNGKWDDLYFKRDVPSPPKMGEQVVSMKPVNIHVSPIAEKDGDWVNSPTTGTTKRDELYLVSGVAEVDDGYFWIQISSVDRVIRSRAKPSLGAGWPKEVTQLYRSKEASCKKDWDGTALKYSDRHIEALDLNGDGRTDYIVKFGEMECVGSGGSVFCGSGGCDLAVLVSKADGSYSIVFNDQARGYEILDKDRSRKKISVSLHGSYCDKAGHEKCYKILQFSR